MTLGHTVHCLPSNFLQNLGRCSPQWPLASLRLLPLTESLDRIILSLLHLPRRQPRQRLLVALQVLLVLVSRTGGG